MSMHTQNTIDQAKTLGLPAGYLDYEPEVLIEDIFKCGEEDWIKQMQKGIGSSSAGVMMGASKYKTREELIMEKITDGGLPLSDEVEMKTILALGHHTEPAMAIWYASKIGAKVAFIDEENPSTSEIKDESEITDEEWERAEREGYGIICTDRRRLAYPKAPYIFTDVDAVYHPPCKNMKEYRYILEFKTFRKDTLDMLNARADEEDKVIYWKSGTWPDAAVGNESYIWQARQHMLVTNTDRCDIIAMGSLNPSDIYRITVLRDLAEEQKLIKQAKATWDAVKTGEVGELISVSDKSYPNLATMLCPEKIRENKEEFVLPEAARADIEEYLELGQQKKEYKKAIDEIEERMNALNLKFIPLMEGKSNAQMPSLIEGKTIYFTLKEQVRNSWDKDRFELENPELYDKYRTVKTTGEKKLVIKEKRTVKKKS